MATFLAECQFKYGGISKAPGEQPGEQLFQSRPMFAERMRDQIRTTHICLSQYLPFYPMLQKTTRAGSCPGWTHSGMRLKRQRNGRESTYRSKETAEISRQTGES